MAFKPSLTTLPPEAWEPAAVAQLALIILLGAALLNLIERIILAIKVRMCYTQDTALSLRNNSKNINNPTKFPFLITTPSLLIKTNYLPFLITSLLLLNLSILRYQIHQSYKQTCFWK